MPASVGHVMSRAVPLIGVVNSRHRWSRGRRSWLMRTGTLPTEHERMANAARVPEPSLTAADLITLGRDREAVIAATRETYAAARPESHEGGTMTGLDQLDTLMPTLVNLVDGVRADQLDAPTPCAKFAVADVLEHMVGGASMFAPEFRGDAPAAAAATDGELRDRWLAAMADLGDAVHSPGALDRTIASPFGPVPGGDFARYLAFDGLMHAWDIATATGQPLVVPDDVVAEVDAFARGLIGPDMRDGDTFAAETEPPPDATPLERLVAFSGRRVPR